MNKKDIAIIMGSISDWAVMQKAVDILKKFSEITYDVDIVSAHRTPEQMFKFAKDAHNKYKIIIAGAGGSAHLPGMVASLCIIPVIGVPIYTKLQGVDSLYSIVQMPFGTPVATVGIDAANNAALLAIRILSINSLKLQNQLLKFKNDLLVEVENSKKSLK